jgi:hypothetical protein
VGAFDEGEGIVKTVTFNPDEWQLVPKVRTTAMKDAGKAAYGMYKSVVDVYGAMLRAAPEHPAAGVGERAPMSAESVVEWYWRQEENQFRHQPETLWRSGFDMGLAAGAQAAMTVAQIRRMRAATPEPAGITPDQITQWANDVIEELGGEDGHMVGAAEHNLATAILEGRAPEPAGAGPTELEMHRADYAAVQEAGFESPGELLAAYKHLSSKLFLTGPSMDHMDAAYKLLPNDVRKALSIHMLVEIRKALNKVRTEPSTPQPLPGRVLDANDVYTTVAVGSEDAYCREHGARRVWVSA